MKKIVTVFVLVSVFLWNASAFAATAIAEIKPTKEGSTLFGKAVMTDTEDGLKVSLSLENAPPGTHGFHIHENGACGDEGKAAGGHYNPDGAPHGLLSKEDRKSVV